MYSGKYYPSEFGAKNNTPLLIGLGLFLVVLVIVIVIVVVINSKNVPSGGGGGSGGNSEKNPLVSLADVNSVRLKLKVYGQAVSEWRYGTGGWQALAYTDPTTPYDNQVWTFVLAAAVDARNKAESVGLLGTWPESNNTDDFQNCGTAFTTVTQAQDQLVNHGGCAMPKQSDINFYNEVKQLNA